MLQRRCHPCPVLLYCLSAAAGGFRRGEREEREPSRADTVSDWSADRKFTPSDSSDRSRGFGGGFGGSRGGFGDRDKDGGGFGDRPRREDRSPSAADTTDDWGANRKFVPAASGDSRSFGTGFGRDRDRPRTGFSDSIDPPRADTGDWGARRGPPPAEEPGASSSGRRGYGFSDHPVSPADMQDRWSRRAAAEPSDRPAEQSASERPRLKLAPRTKPLETPLPAANGVGPGSPAAAVSSPTGSGEQQAPAKPRSNPFGAAKPREEVLKEKGIDYRKQEMKLDHGEVIRWARDSVGGGWQCIIENLASLHARYSHQQSRSGVNQHRYSAAGQSHLMVHWACQPAGHASSHSAALPQCSANLIPPQPIMRLCIT